MYDQVKKSDPKPIANPKPPFPAPESVEEFLFALFNRPVRDRHEILLYIRERLTENANEAIKGLRDDIEIAEDRIQELQKFVESVRL